MTDYIKREDALKIWVRDKETTEEFASCVKAIPAADVVKVVRCKNCVYFTQSKDFAGFGNCQYGRYNNFVIHPETHFCGDGRGQDDGIF